jgi:hypothetical protein
MTLELEDILARERGRLRKVERDPLMNPKTSRAIRGTSGPETRSTPIAPRAGALAMAAMVSAGEITPASLREVEGPAAAGC